MCVVAGGAFDAVGDGNPVPVRVGCPRLEWTAPTRAECPRGRRVEETLLDIVADAQAMGAHDEDPAEARQVLKGLRFQD